jgi:carboxypeptidase C (cathepsin A)
MTSTAFRIGRTASRIPAAVLFFCGLCLFAVRTVRADKEPAAPTTQSSVTEHDLTLDGQPVHYRATAGELPLTDDQDKQSATIFYVAYEKATAGGSATQPAGDPARPITFIFNGGPGSAAVWLHMGCAGPKRIVTGPDGFPPSPPYSFTDNPQSWLDFTDLVFIDPVGTGYSRASDPDKAKEFYNVEGDIHSVANFIRLYCTRNNRWLSPKYLAGESYGTTRAAGLSEFLHDRYGIDLNGIVLISTVLNFQTLEASPGNDTPYPLYIPSFTAVAHYHHKLPDDLQADLKKAVAESEQWAMTDYANALAKGNSLDDAAREQIVDKLVRYTGLPRDYVERSNLRIDLYRFEKELLASEHKVIGRMDARVTGFDADGLSDHPEYDPSVDRFLGVFTDTFNDYIRRDLKFTSDDTYEVLSARVQGWSFGKDDSYLNVVPTLQRAMIENPSLELLVCSGYYDLATPFAAADYTVNSMVLNKELRANVTQAYFEGGHMLYLNPPALAQLKQTVRGFYQPPPTR